MQEAALVSSPVGGICDGIHSRGDGDQEVLEDVLAAVVPIKVLRVARVLHPTALAAPSAATHIEVSAYHDVHPMSMSMSDRMAECTTCGRVVAGADLTYCGMPP